MRKYTDRHGKEHSVEITLLHRRQIRERLEIDLVKCAHDSDALNEMLQEISTDELCGWEMLAIIEGSTADSLMAAADGDTHEAALDALLGAIVDFFPQRSTLRAPLLRLIDKVKDSQDEAIMAARAALMEHVENLSISSVLVGAQVLTNG
jgi:DnaJ-domain-containing protein 1